MEMIRRGFLAIVQSNEQPHSSSTGPPSIGSAMCHGEDVGIHVVFDLLLEEWQVSSSTGSRTFHFGDTSVNRYKNL